MPSTVKFAWQSQPNAAGHASARFVVQVACSELITPTSSLFSDDNDGQVLPLPLLTMLPLLLQ
jgi:hypothetical protein